MGLESVDVSNNQLEGKLPKSLINCTFLELLNVESNKIKDTFPSWLSSLPSLHVMILRSNEFYGPVYRPHVYIGFQSLKVIDISHNHFTGTLPAFYFSNWREMTELTEEAGGYMADIYLNRMSMEMVNKGVDTKFEGIQNDLRAIDFSRNKFHGMIPDSIGLLNKLRLLNLSGNAFTSNIPQSLANLTGLESLDLSRNQLSGQIPQDLGSLSFLAVMNFSHNNLEGPIPRGGQVRVQPCSVFMDNPRLYGLEDICGETHHILNPTPQESEDLSEPKEQVISWIAAAVAYVPDKITEEIKEIFTSGVVPRSINSTHIRLIPKVPSPKTVAEYRPIALCNVFYKIISKILTSRLQPILPSIISETQTAYVKGRAISDNVLITHEVLHYLKGSRATKHCSMAVKTDMSKAYDRLEWSFIVAVLERLGFHAKWINMILQCISTVSFSFLVNGAAQGSVQPQRGIRQGDPLSPYIFIICGEVLSGLCRNAQDNGKLLGIQVSRGSPRLNHLLFADDTMFFCKTNQQSCESLTLILQKYEKASGQMINAHKSSISFSSKTPGDIRERVKKTLGIEKEGGQGKYLGLPESFGRKKKDLFSLIVDRIHQRSVKYSSRFLSSAGKLTMLKSVLSAMPTYSMSCFKLPAGLCKRIQSALTRFWWDTKIGERKMCWLSWDKLTRSKRDGGLGFRDIQSYNDAFLAKLSWRILTNPECLLARVLQGKYCKDHHFLQAPLPSSTSHGWRGIIIGRDLHLKKLGKAIGNGLSTSLWNDPWLSLSNPTCPFGPPSCHHKDLMVSDLLTTNGHDWNQSKIKDILPHHSSEILQIKPSRKGAHDSYIWLPTKSGAYSVKTGYHTSLEMREDSIGRSSEQINWNGDIWTGKFSPKMKVFLWKIVLKALPLGDNLLSRGLPDNACCVHCGDLETAEHLFFNCHFAQQVWSLTPLKTPINPSLVTSFTTSLVASKHMICLPPTGLNRGPIFPWLIWSIWTARNYLIFEERAFTPEETILKALLEAKEWQYAQNNIDISLPTP
ncbi:unnamed protein product [Microthlaspi erraticum]|uniref:Reverse transcriptase domain-containing protein n=1 Tax=Microthlaspi erraticum TaxID=1685480 RepID=A0A6D2JSI1_9BRAS|nr:unnamed protein product [Microthlaspi erraticum]